MKLVTDGPRERLMVMGAAGAGKSNAAISIAKATQVPMYVIDTEGDTWERLLWKEEGVEKVVVYPTMPNDWTAMNEAVVEIRDRIVKDEWAVLDSATHPWGAAQDWFGEEFMGDDLADLMLKARADAAAGSTNPFDGWRDWSVINAQYAKFMNNMLRINVTKKAHVFMTAELDVIGDDDHPATRAMFGKFGAKPRGQKRLAHVPHDILFMRQTKNAWEVDTAKAQGVRKSWKGEVSEEFAKQYLLGVAGWSMEKSADE